MTTRLKQPRVGEIWRWVNLDDHPSYQWDDLWLMLSNDFPNADAFLAINIETGEVQPVFPTHSPRDWTLFL